MKKKEFFEDIEFSDYSYAKKVYEDSKKGFFKCKIGLIIAIVASILGLVSVLSSDEYTRNLCAIIAVVLALVSYVVGGGFMTAVRLALKVGKWGWIIAPFPADIFIGIITFFIALWAFFLFPVLFVYLNFRQVKKNYTDAVAYMGININEEAKTERDVALRNIQNGMQNASQKISLAVNSAKENINSTRENMTSKRTESVKRELTPELTNHDVNCEKDNTYDMEISDDEETELERYLASMRKEYTVSSSEQDQLRAYIEELKKNRALSESKENLTENVAKETVAKSVSDAIVAASRTVHARLTPEPEIEPGPVIEDTSDKINASEQEQLLAYIRELKGQRETETKEPVESEVISKPEEQPSEPAQSESVSVPDIIPEPTPVVPETKETQMREEIKPMIQSNTNIEKPDVYIIVDNVERGLLGGTQEYSAKITGKIGTVSVKYLIMRNVDIPKVVIDQDIPIVIASGESELAKIFANGGYNTYLTSTSIAGNTINIADEGVKMLYTKEAPAKEFIENIISLVVS